MLGAGTCFRCKSKVNSILRQRRLRKADEFENSKVKATKIYTQPMQT